MFRDAFHRRRCIVPADAFYEWQAQEVGPKQPYAIARRDGELLAFAGLWEGWRGPAAEILRTFSIIVTAANEDLAPIHDRMPAILEERHWATWLGEEEGDLGAMLAPGAAGLLRLWPVSGRVNRPANNGPELLAAIG